MLSSFSYTGRPLTCLFLGKCLFRSFSLFQTWLFVFLLLSCRSSLYFFMLIVSQIYVLQTFSTILDVAFSFYPWLPEVKWLGGKESACQSRGMDSIPGSGSFPGQVNIIPLQYSCLEILRIEEPGGICPMGSPRVRHDLGTKTQKQQEIKLSTFVGLLKKQQSSKTNIYIWFIDYAKAFDCVDHHKLWKIMKEMGIPDHLTCLLRNLYAG